MRFQEYLTEDKHTDYLETASCLGAVVPSSVIKKIDDFFDTGDNGKEIRNELTTYLDRNYDWVKRGVEEVKKAMSKDKGFVEVVSLVKGMSNFIEDITSSVITSNVQFVHNGIDDYYEVEKEVFGELKGTKANTADCLIANTSPKQVFESLRNSPYSVNEDDGYVSFEDGIKFFQVSLKKGRDQAQLGKVTKKLKSMGFDVSPTSELTEAKVINWIKKVSKKTWDKVSSFTKKITQPLIKRVKKKFKKDITDKDLAEVSKLIKEGKISDKTQDLVDSILKSPNNLLSKINSYIDDIKSREGEGVYVSIDKLNQVKKIENPDTAFKLVSNFKTVKILDELMDDVDGIGSSIKSLLSDMLFGGTKLPLWKVYGDFGSGISYEYLGTIERFVSEEMPIGIEVFGVKISPAKKQDYYTITVAMLEKVDNEGKHYVIFRTGTNSSSHFTFILEGTKIEVIGMDKKLDSLL